MNRTSFWLCLGMTLIPLGGTLSGQFQAAPGVSVQCFIEIPKDAPRSKVDPKVPDGVTPHENIVFGTGGGRELKLDLYTPSGEGPHAAVMLVHGGGWTGGNKEAFRSMAQQFAARGFVAATIEYRLATEAPFPGAVEDCKAALRWLRANAATYKIDPARIGAVGGSAGGHLAGMVATTSDPAQFEGSGGNADQSSALQAVVLMGAGVDQATRAQESPKPIDSQLKFFGGTYAEKKDVYVAASPITHVSARTPPMLFIEGEFDTPGERYIEMRKKLDALQVPNRLVIVQGGKHGCWGQNPWMMPMVEEIASFLKTHLAASAK
ncbi:alpha/beta hydrolase [Prosthecobacter sp.]|uniref:alpha/beta hydrolase n=1 Tax=Prosthecobacter sp. TaxID=1965333 RepID=UPI001D793CCB|nr:alpha/beta hydrolase [Prosthecobacter sp.]MCB1276673.1 alpha/beta hydrolase [Prosthecobacter sp.]